MCRTSIINAHGSRPREATGRGRRTFWTYHTRLSLRYVGDVTVVLSKRGRNLGPKQTKILVTNLAALTPSQVVTAQQFMGLYIIDLLDLLLIYF